MSNPVTFSSNVTVNGITARFVVFPPVFVIVGVGLVMSGRLIGDNTSDTVASFDSAPLLLRMVYRKLSDVAVVFPARYVTVPSPFTLTVPCAGCLVICTDDLSSVLPGAASFPTTFTLTDLFCPTEALSLLATGIKAE